MLSPTRGSSSLITSVGRRAMSHRGSDLPGAGPAVPGVALVHRELLRP